MRAEAAVVGGRHTGRRWAGRVFAAVCLACTLAGVAMLAVLLVGILREGWGRLSLDFLNSFPSRFPERAGIKSALYGTLWLMGFTALFSVPVGIGAAVYLEEYAPRNWLTRVIQTNIANLAGVPSIVYGILGLALFVRALALQRSLLAGALTMALLVLPVIIIAAQEAVRAVPPSVREASYALGATRWQTVRSQVLPVAMPGIMTGIILALSRAIGETAPLILISGLTYVAFTPSGPLDDFTVLPIQIFNWAARPQAGFHENAAAAIIVLLAVLLTLNLGAILLRNRYQKRVKW